MRAWTLFALTGLAALLLDAAAPVRANAAGHEWGLDFDEDARLPTGCGDIAWACMTSPQRAVPPHALLAMPSDSVAALAASVLGAAVVSAGAAAIVRHRRRVRAARAAFHHLLAYAEFAEMEGWTEDTLGCLAGAHEVAPRVPGILEWMARTHLRRGESHAALACYRHAAALYDQGATGGDHDAHLQAAILADRLGDRPGALWHLRRAVDVHAHLKAEIEADATEGDDPLGALRAEWDKLVE